MARCNAQLEVLQADKGKKQSRRGRKHNRARVAGGRITRHEAKKTKKSAFAVRKAVKKVGTSRKRVERRLDVRNVNEGSGLKRYRILRYISPRGSQRSCGLLTS